MSTKDRSNVRLLKLMQSELSKRPSELQGKQLNCRDKQNVRRSASGKIPYIKGKSVQNKSKMKSLQVLEMQQVVFLYFGSPSHTSLTLHDFTGRLKRPAAVETAQTVAEIRQHDDIARATNAKRAPRKRTTKKTLRLEDGSLKNALTVIPPAKRINWQHHLLWPPIAASAKKVGYQARAIVKDLQTTFVADGLYNSLQPGTVSGWIHTMSMPRRWKESVLLRVEEGSCWKKGIKKSHGSQEKLVKLTHIYLKGTGRTLLLDQEPQLVEDVSKSLRALRAAGLPVNASVARNTILGFIKQQYPHLLRQANHDALQGPWTPQLSIHTVRRFLHRELKWVVRAGTKAAQKLPKDWEIQCEKTFFRLVYTIAKERVHQSLLVNADQTGVILVPGGSQKTYEEQGSRQVLIHGKEEKRAFTTVLATSNDGTVLPTQSVHKGKTPASLPSFNRRAPAEEKGHRFSLNPSKHWSSLETTKRWFDEILFPYREQMIKKHGLEPTAKVIVYIDCWSVHRSAALGAWLRAPEQKFVVPIFVPANCTC
jgi:hypothetical protein